MENPEAKHKPRILAVDDDDRNLRLLEAMLIPLGYEVIFARDGEEGIHLARSQKPDLILLDVLMPKMDGYTTLSSIKSDPATKDIPVVMVTALGYELNKKLAEQLGAVGYVTKPVGCPELGEVIGRVLPTS